MKLEKFEFQKEVVKLETRKKKIFDRIITVFKNPVNREEIIPFIEKTSQGNLWNTFSTDQKKEIEEANKKIEENSVVLNNLSEFRYALIILSKLGGWEDPENEIRNVLSHENAHMNKAEELGLKGICYEILPYKDEEDNSLGIFYTSNSENHPADWTLEKSIEVGIKINQAPEEYDSVFGMSDFDKEDAKKLDSIRQ